MGTVRRDFFIDLSFLAGLRYKADPTRKVNRNPATSLSTSASLHHETIRLQTNRETFFPDCIDHRVLDGRHAFRYV
jgi:hypothetical protein